MHNFLSTICDQIGKSDLRELYIAPCPKSLLPPQKPFNDYSKEIILTPTLKV